MLLIQLDNIFNKQSCIKPLLELIVFTSRNKGLQLFQRSTLQIKTAFKFKVNEMKKQSDKKVFWKQLFEEQSTEQVQQQVEDEVVEFNQEEEMVNMFAKKNQDLIMILQKKLEMLILYQIQKNDYRNRQLIQLILLYNKYKKWLFNLLIKGNFNPKKLECLQQIFKCSQRDIQSTCFLGLDCLLRNHFNQQYRELEIQYYC
ncbi:unnamed protein product [Paramecium pentaurelia]|uniref:Uncharacterized protein n=1 Tax=Paramecium pentaurelia TaxID=43138 RepID=A0A8S1XXC3_9CILI|nr:unnamed protein product [Paramecium pentaurelia]